MHIDATVLFVHETVRFEIDSRGHFKGNCRQQADVDKDRVLNSCRIMVFRLHEDDKHQWDLYVEMAKELVRSGEEGCVYYSASYENMLCGRQRSCVMRLG
jgi:hypothetical protein